MGDPTRPDDEHQRFDRTDDGGVRRVDLGPGFMEMYNVVKPAPDDDDFRKIALALLNPKWNMRTISGLAKETGLDGDQISEAIDRNMQEILSNPDGKYWFLRLRAFHLKVPFLMTVFGIKPNELGMQPEWLDQLPPKDDFDR